MAETGVRLSIDYWHTTVAAALCMPNGRIVALAVDGAAVSPSGVAVDDDRQLRTGRDGIAAGTHHPQAYVRMPGQRLFEERVTVGPVDMDPVDLVATLSQVARETLQLTGVAPGMW